MTRSAAELEAIGRELVAARAVGTCWKVLEQHYGLGRARLNQLWRAARQPPSTGRKKMSIDISALANRPADRAEG